MVLLLPEWVTPECGRGQSLLGIGHPDLASTYPSQPRRKKFFWGGKGESTEIPPQILPPLLAETHRYDRFG